MVGQQPLKLFILVRIQASEHNLNRARTCFFVCVLVVLGLSISLFFCIILINNMNTEPNGQSKKISGFSFFFYFLIIVLVVTVIFKFSEVQNILSLFRQIKPIWFLLAIVTQTTTYLFTACNYYSILSFYKYQGKFSYFELFKTSIIILFLNQAVPTGGVSGNSYLLYRFNQKKIPSHQGFSIVILEIFTYFFSHLVLLFLGLFYLYIFIPGQFSTRVWVLGIFCVFIFIFSNLF